MKNVSFNMKCPWDISSFLLHPLPLYLRIFHSVIWGRICPIAKDCYASRVLQKFIMVCDESINVDVAKEV
jgi:hypothetical protein